MLTEERDAASRLSNESFNHSSGRTQHNNSIEIESHGDQKYPANEFDEDTAVLESKLMSRMNAFTARLRLQASLASASVSPITDSSSAPEIDLTHVRRSPTVVPFYRVLKAHAPPSSQKLEGEMNEGINHEYKEKSSSTDAVKSAQPQTGSRQTSSVIVSAY